MENKIDITKLKAQDFMNELPEMVRSLEAVRSGSQDKKPVEVTLENWLLVNGVFQKMNFLKRWASIQKWTQCRTSLQCLNRMFVGLFRKSFVLLSHWVCARLRSIRTSSHLTNLLMVCKQSCRWLICRMLHLQRLTRQKLSHWVMLASDRNQLASSKSERLQTY